MNSGDGGTTEELLLREDGEEVALACGTTRDETDIGIEAWELFSHLTVEAACDL